MLERLVEASLVTEVSTYWYKMHDLLRLLARDLCRETDGDTAWKAAETRLVACYADLAGFIDESLDPRHRRTEGCATAQREISFLPEEEALAHFADERSSLLYAVDLAAKRGDHGRVWQLSQRMEGALRRLRYHADLATVWEAALAAAVHTENTQAEGEALKSLGIAYEYLGNFTAAVNCFERSLAIARAAGDREGESVTLCNLGIAHQELKDLAQAVRCFEESLAISQEIGNRHNEPRIAINLGTAYGDLGKFEDAIRCLNEVLVIVRESGAQSTEEAIVLTNLAEVYRRACRFKTALRSCSEALAIALRTCDRRLAVQILVRFGDVYQEQQPHHAAECWQLAAALMRGAGEHVEATRLEQLAATVRSQRRRWPRWRPTTSHDTPPAGNASSA